MNTIDKLVNLDMYMNFKEAMNLVERLNPKDFNLNDKGAFNKLRTIHTNILKAYMMINFTAPTKFELKDECKKAGMKVADLLNSFSKFN